MTVTEHAKPLTIDAPGMGRGGSIALLVSELNEISTFELCSIVTLVLLFLYAGTEWYLTVPMKSVTLCAIFLPRLRGNSTLWLLVTVLMASANCYDRLLIDNHKYLMTYWCLAVLLSSLEKDVTRRDQLLAFNGQLLLGLCFLFAVIAKIYFQDYLDGGFFHHTLLLDNRFVNFTWLVGGVHRSTIAEMRAVLDDAQRAYLLGISEDQIHVVNSLRLERVVHFMTWWTISIESSIAAAFLLPWKNPLFDWGRRYLLWVFLFTTYSVALVSGFAWLLAVMGLAQLPRRRANYRIVYVLIMAVALQLYEVHYVSIIRSLFAYVLPGSNGP